ncbi:Ulp1 family isopeptidase [Bradyrhizobium sp. B120]|uniref:Ulp1 family isopeptidase n=1 Tax=Bradyrhizobium sp. B120 TaxID=3410088 RepID=UPI003B97E6BF
MDDNAHFAPAPSARARSDIYGGFPLVDLTAPTLSELRNKVDSVRAFPTTSNTQIGTLDPTASSSRSRLTLGDTQWLTDEHILRDYQLLEEELRRTNPNLAGQTQFVDPLVATQLTWGDTLSAFHSIVHDRQGHDTAGFLFLPVNDAHPTDPDLRGSHWSLLFVDRNNRQRPVAYHYDSIGRYNAKPARQLPDRLGASLEWPRAPTRTTPMIAASLSSTPRGSWLVNWRKEGSQTC